MPVAVLLLAALGSPSTAEDGLAYATSYVESFADSEGYLTGALVPSSRGVWTVSVEDGTAWLVNDKDNSALRYYDLPAVPVAFVEDLVSTDAAAIEAAIAAEDAPDGGAGLLIGYPHGIGYLVFAVGSNQRYRILRKEDGRLTSLENGTHDAIAAEGFNQLRVERSAWGLDFLVNGTSVFRFEADDATWAVAPVGVAVFGRGRFAIDEVRVEPHGVADEAIGVAARNVCGLPAPGPADQLVTVGIYEGQAISTLSLAGLDGVTSSAGLHVEYGDAPLYLVVSSHDSLLWRLDGDTSRIAHIAVIGPARAGPVASGVIGLDASRVSFHGQRECQRRSEYDIGSQGFRRNNALIALWTGHAPVATLGEYDLNAMFLPSGAPIPIDTPMGIQPEWESQALREALHFSPAGLFDAQADLIATESTITEPETLPQQFGLAQLLAAGTLVRDGQFYRVTGPMRYPAGLYGAHSVNFIVEAGVPEPTGDPGHSRVERTEAGDDTVVPEFTGTDEIRTLR
jgi:hypothetical protein